MSLVAIQYCPSTVSLKLLDQRRLPSVTEYVTCSSAGEVAQAIADMVVRGAPAIGITAGYGLAIAQRKGEDLKEAQQVLASSRPTAVNLAWALGKLVREENIEKAAQELHRDDIDRNRRLGGHGAPLLSGGTLTVCNTGSLATGGHGTALGMVRSALEEGRDVRLFACETRPYNQGSRLTTYECVVDKIPCTLIADSMAAALMAAGKVTSVVAGCDRVAANGDTANKIGTYSLAVLARHHGIPFYVAMPLSTLDRDCPSGAHIPIEERPGAELFSGLEVSVWNPAFDVTPADLITAWVTEEGVWGRDKFSQ